MQHDHDPATRIIVDRLAFCVLDRDLSRQSVIIRIRATALGPTIIRKISHRAVLRVTQKKIEILVDCKARLAYIVRPKPSLTSGLVPQLGFPFERFPDLKLCNRALDETSLPRTPQR
jgi:hypothetical protein